jgi:hypothetical protein|nr:hypothetical protein [uncultured Steroidobacter sp.]
MRIILLVACISFCFLAHAADSPIANFICDPVTDAGERAQCIERASVATRHETTKISEGLPWFSMIWPTGWWIVYYGFGLLIARYIHRDARERDWLFVGIRPVWWAVLAFFDPAFGLLVYWAVHYSKFAQSYQEATARPPESAPTA